MRHKLDNDFWVPWTDIKNGQYSYFEKRYSCKLTKELLEEAVKNKLVKSKVLTSETGFDFVVYCESDIIYCLGRHKFKIKVPEWFE